MRLDATTLTVEQVQREATDLARLAGPHGDYEALHGMEDNLRRVVLEAIAIGHLTGTDAQRAALAATQTTSLPFPRHCA